MAARLTERSYQLYHAYAAKRPLPTRRLELMLARVCLVLAQVNGAKDVDLTDFLFDPAEEDDVPLGDNLAAQKQIFGFNPRPKG